MQSIPKPTTKQWIKAIIAIALITLDVLGLIDTKSINTTKNNVDTSSTETQKTLKTQDYREQRLCRESVGDPQLIGKDRESELEGRSDEARGVRTTFEDNRPDLSARDTTKKGVPPKKKQITTITNNKIQTTWDY